MTYQKGPIEASQTAKLRRPMTCFRLMLFVVLVAVSGIILAANGQTPPVANAQTPPAPNAQTPPLANGQTAPATNKPPVKKTYTLRISKEEIIGVSLKADKAKLSEVAAELAKALNAKVILGPKMQKELLTVDFSDLTLEQAMRLLAPHVYLDYEIRAGAERKLLGILLFAESDAAPLTNAVVEGNSQGMLIEGNTEDNGQPSDDDPLQVDLDDNDRLTIKSKKQPLVVVVLTVADVLGVPAEIKYDSTEIVDTVIKDIVFEDAVSRLSPNVRLYVRDDLTLSRKTALKLSLVPPAGTAVSQ